MTTSNNTKHKRTNIKRKPAVFYKTTGNKRVFVLTKCYYLRELLDLEDELEPELLLLLDEEERADELRLLDEPELTLLLEDERLEDELLLLPLVDDGRVVSLLPDVLELLLLVFEELLFLEELEVASLFLEELLRSLLLPDELPEGRV